MQTKQWKVGGSGVATDLDILRQRAAQHVPSARPVESAASRRDQEVLLAMQRGEVDGAVRLVVVEPA